VRVKVVKTFLSAFSAIIFWFRVPGEPGKRGGETSVSESKSKRAKL